jgi:nucleoside 2-deoxyribosyltransferase
MTSIYLIGSLRNDKVPELAEELRKEGFSVFDQWHAAGPEADDWYYKYAKARGWSYSEALDSHFARHVFLFDKTHIDAADIGVLLMPAGRSGHIELGYMLGRGKPGFVLFPEEPERFDQMYQFTSGVYFDLASLIAGIQETVR